MGKEINATLIDITSRNRRLNVLKTGIKALMVEIFQPKIRKIC